MPKRSVWLLLGLLAGCADSDASLRGRETYQALGHEPGWTLTLRDARLKFATSTPNTLLEYPRPLPALTANGRRYVTDRLSLDITHVPCNDRRNGVAFADTVTVVLNGYSYRGCGGRREPLLDR